LEDFGNLCRGGKVAPLYLCKACQTRFHVCRNCMETERTLRTAGPEVRSLSSPDDNVIECGISLRCLPRPSSGTSH
jgi:hypothetical protein